MAIAANAESMNAPICDGRRDIARCCAIVVDWTTCRSGSISRVAATSASADPGRIRGRADDKVEHGAAVTLGIVLVDDVARCFPERSHVDIAGHADNHQVGLGRIRPAEDAAQRVPVWPVATGHGLADDGHGLRVSPIAFVEGAASHDRHAGRVEERTVHGGAIGAERLLARGRDASVDGEVSVAGGEARAAAARRARRLRRRAAPESARARDASAAQPRQKSNARPAS